MADISFSVVDICIAAGNDRPRIGSSDRSLARTIAFRSRCSRKHFAEQRTGRVSLQLQQVARDEADGSVRPVVYYALWAEGLL